MFKFISTVCLAGFLVTSTKTLANDAETNEHYVQLTQAAHVCNDEEETKRLAANDHLREMAKALVEFKATQFCFIMQPAVVVKLLEQQPGYVKFSHEEKILYTFADNLISMTN